MSILTKLLAEISNQLGIYYVAEYANDIICANDSFIIALIVGNLGYGDYKSIISSSIYAKNICFPKEKSLIFIRVLKLPSLFLSLFDRGFS